MPAGQPRKHFSFFPIALVTDSTFVFKSLVRTTCVLCGRTRARHEWCAPVLPATDQLTLRAVCVPHVGSDSHLPGRPPQLPHRVSHARTPLAPSPSLLRLARRRPFGRMQTTHAPDSFTCASLAVSNPVPHPTFEGIISGKHAKGRATLCKHDTQRSTAAERRVRDA